MKNIQQIRLYFIYSLIFCFYILSCRNHVAHEIVLGWEDRQVKKISIPLSSVDGSPRDSLPNHLNIHLAKPGAPAILGSYTFNDEFVVFQPMIPFTSGLKYEVRYKDKKLADIEIPAPEGSQAPVVTGIYPSEDSLPENLLKVYISFSQPMQEGVSDSQVVLIKDGSDTIRNVFLNLQPELWNHDRTMLTLWLNPGRIKRDLIPNREEGPPLVPNAHYALLVKAGWQDGNGMAMEKLAEKHFVTVVRDTVSPDVYTWNIISPKPGARDLLTINLGESLDYQLLYNSIRVFNSQGIEVAGQVQAISKERSWQFQPKENWVPGTYSIRIEPKLEDLAGNNLNRLFDTDLTKPKRDQKVEYKRDFKVN